jgi:demethylmenaquinone methyltransferase / 2-methoxy-6-polyprenyl-1,4-benzoquinol methylase
MPQVDSQSSDVQHPIRLAVPVVQPWRLPSSPVSPKAHPSTATTSAMAAPAATDATAATAAISAIDLSGGLPEGEAKVRAVQDMFDAISPRYDLVNRIMTFRLDVRWRRIAVRSLGLAPGSLIVDLAAGTGDLCNDLERAHYRPIGMDLSFGMLSHARTPAPLVQCDALQLPLADGAVDGVTCGFALRNFVELGGFFDEVARIVRPGGRIAFVDAAQPENPVLRFGHGIYFGKVVPAIGGLLSDRTAYSYLPKSLAYLPPPPVMIDRLQSAGFSGVQRRLLTGGAAHLLVATRAR